MKGSKEWWKIYWRSELLLNKNDQFYINGREMEKQWINEGAEKGELHGSSNGGTNG